jgi:glycosyltransferase involved in cell wall biosynthesis
LILFAFPTKKATTLGSVAYTIKNRAYRTTINHAIYKSKGIIAVSENTSKDILRFFTSVDKNKISTIYEGAGGEDDNEINKYKNISVNNRREWLQKKLSVKFPFIFYLGGAYPHKNLERLILAFDAIQKKNNKPPLATTPKALSSRASEARPGIQKKNSELFLDPRLTDGQAGFHQDDDLHLVIAGGNDYFFDRLKKLVAQKKIKNVIFPGFIKNRKTLEFLYQEALFCIFPSLYEGFGLPPLEALKRNKLVLCNNGTCFPEILGDSVVYFNGESIENITKTITSTIKNLESLKKTYLPRAQKTLTRYSWDKMARETLELYENTIEK